MQRKNNRKVTIPNRKLILDFKGLQQRLEKYPDTEGWRKRFTKVYLDFKGLHQRLKKYPDTENWRKRLKVHLSNLKN